MLNPDSNSDSGVTARPTLLIHAGGEAQSCLGQWPWAPMLIVIKFFQTVFRTHPYLIPPSPHHPKPVTLGGLTVLILNDFYSHFPPPTPLPWFRSIWVFVCLFVFNYACRSGWGVCGEWVPQIFLLAAIRLVSHSSMVQEPLSYSLHFSQKELFSEWLIELMSL